MQDKSDLWSVTKIIELYGISRMTIHRRVKEGVLVPANASPILYRQHRLMFNPSDVIAVFGKPINQAA